MTFSCDSKNGFFCTADLGAFEVVTFPTSIHLKTITITITRLRLSRLTCDHQSINQSINQSSLGPHTSLLLMKANSHKNQTHRCLTMSSSCTVCRIPASSTFALPWPNPPNPNLSCFPRYKQPTCRIPTLRAGSLQR
jgi:hypothetical protein